VNHDHKENHMLSYITEQGLLWGSLLFLLFIVASLLHAILKGIFSAD